MKSRGQVWGYSVRTLAAMAFALMVFGSANGGLREEYGDGLWHDIGSGWEYRYVNSIDSGYWRFSGIVRFGFDYDPGQWWNQGITWTKLSGIGLTEGDWVGDGTFHDLNNGWSYKYLTSITSGYWNNGGMTRFGYHYSVGQWWDNRNEWAKLGSEGVSQAFIGDGEFHDLNNGWSYKYLTSITSGYWNDGSITRFGYLYSVGQWWDNRNGWAKLGSEAVSQAFIGDGTFHDLNNGWSYKYLTSITSGYWNDGSITRFGYLYSVGQWWDNCSGWSKLGSEGVSQAFVGDGTFHDLNNGWSYKYLTSITSGYWNNGGITRFGYHYSVGQWWDNRNGWAKLGSEGVSQVFIGDGVYHNLNNGWWYEYNKAQDRSYWETGGVERFCYHYDNGQWWDWGISWYELSAEGVSQAFVGDGAAHDLFNGLSYSYDKDLAIGYWLVDGANRFRYEYLDGDWYHYGPVGDDYVLATDVSARFLGAYTSTDRLTTIYSGFEYWYDSPSDTGYWWTGGAVRFHYVYGDGQWFHYGPVGGGFQLATGASAQFLADYDQDHMLDVGDRMGYWYSSGTGYWATTGGNRFHYVYGDGQWFHYGPTDTVGLQLSETGRPARFLGDYTKTDSLNLGNGFDYWYDAGVGWWLVGGKNRFHYYYSIGRWYHYGPDGVWWQLSETDRSARFLGTYSEGERLDLGNGFDYWYDMSSGTGYWWTGGGKLFHYVYGNGRWSHYRSGDATAWQLSATGASSRFPGSCTESDRVDLKNGFSFWYAGGIGYWWAGSGKRFHYVYGDGQWFQYGPSDAAGQQLSGTGTSGRFLGDYAESDRLDVGNGFSYWYDSASGIGYYWTDEGKRFHYAYGDGQWFQYGPNDTTGQRLSQTGKSARFIFWYGWWDPLDLGNGFKYWYNGDSDTGYWFVLVGEDSRNRFHYNYSAGYWDHYGPDGSNQQLATGGVSARFPGAYTETDRLDVGDGFSYWYDLASGIGYYWTDEGKRFHYAYGDGQWFQYGPNDTTGQQLSQTGKSARFIFWYGWWDPLDLGNGFKYWYNGDSDTGYWLVLVGEDSRNRFHYNYSAGYWDHYGPDGSNQQLATGGVSARFPGAYTETDRLDVGDGFSYWYDLASGIGYYWTDEGKRFHYAYGDGQWFQYGPNDTTGWQLSQTGKSARFIFWYGWWDPLDLGNGFQYWYHADNGYWLVGGDNRFVYTYPTGTWSMFQMDRFTQLGDAGRSAEFIGDGNEHQLGNGYHWNMQYVADTVKFNLWTDTNTTKRNFLRYSYSSGSWEDTDANQGDDWRQMAGYYLDGTYASELRFLKSDTPQREMRWLFGASHFYDKDFVAVYKDINSGSQRETWYHNYTSSYWWENDNPNWDQPASWACWTTGPTDEHRP